MKRIALFAVLGLIAALVVLFAAPAWNAASQAPRISKEELKALLDDPRLIMIDTRLDEQWHKSEFKLPGAMHQDPWEAEEWAKDFPRDRTIVSYCA